MSNLKTAKEIEEGGIVTTPKFSKNFQTGPWRTFKPVVDESKCKHCAQCVLNCPENCIDISKDGKRGKVNLNFCKGCGVCAKICPFGAITMVPDEK